jgi:hypothetical protein
VTDPQQPDHPRALGAYVENIVCAALAGVTVPAAHTARSKPPIARPWWTERLRKPDSPEGKALWNELNQVGRSIEVLTWSEVGVSDSVNRAFGRYIATFQMQNTLIARSEHLPAAWGRLAWQSGAALAAIRWLADTTERNGATATVVRGILSSWFDSLLVREATLALPIGWGDILVFHRFGEVVAAWGQDLEDQKKRAERQSQQLQRQLKSLRAKRWRAWWPGSRRRRAAIELDLGTAQDALEQASREWNRLVPAAKEVAELAARWTGLDPLAHLPHICNPEVLPVAQLLKSSDYQGLNDWLLVQMASATHHAGLAATGAVFTDATSRDSTSTDEQSWRWRLRMARFYEHWGACLDGGSPSSATAAESGIAILAAREFLKAWNQLCALDLDRQEGAVSRSGGRLHPGGAAEGFYPRFRSVNERVGSRIERLGEQMGLIPQGPITVDEIARWNEANVRLQFFEDSLSDLEDGDQTVKDDPVAWLLRTELVKLYGRWGQQAPSPEDVRRACPDVTKVQTAFVSFFKPWLHLRHAERVWRRRNTTPVAEDFLDRYRGIDPSVVIKVDALRRHLCGVRGAVSVST